MLAGLAPAGPRPRAFCKRKLLCIAGAQDDIRIGPVLRIEERIATDRDRRIGDELHANIAFGAHPRARFRELANADLELRRHLIKHRLQDSTPAITTTLAIQKPRRP